MAYACARFFAMRVKRFTYTSIVFVIALLAIGTSLTIYITSYLKVSHAFSLFIEQQGLSSNIFLEKSTKLNIIILSILCLLVIASISIIFVYYRKLIGLYRMQRNFIHGFTHELKTPVTSIKLYLDTVIKHNLDRDTLLKYIGYMQQDVNRLSDNISNILNLAQIEDNKYLFEPTTIDVKQFIKERIDKNGHIFDTARIETIGPEISVRADKALFETLIMNLLVNAITYTEKDEPHIVINIEKAHDLISIDVLDDGIGISKKEIKNILKQFYRVKKAVKGSGLGLYLVSQIVKLHKWKLEVSSLGLGHGSNFKILIPINIQK